MTFSKTVSETDFKAIKFETSPCYDESLIMSHAKFTLPVNETNLAHCSTHHQWTGLWFFLCAQNNTISTLDTNCNGTTFNWFLSIFYLKQGSSDDSIFQTLRSEGMWCPGIPNLKKMTIWWKNCNCTCITHFYSYEWKTFWSSWKFILLKSQKSQMTQIERAAMDYFSKLEFNWSNHQPDKWKAYHVIEKANHVIYVS